MKKQTMVGAALVSLALLVGLQKFIVAQAAAKSEMRAQMQDKSEPLTTVCFGRFLIDVPQGTEVTWGEAAVPLGVFIHPGKAAMLDEAIASRTAALKKEPRFPTNLNLNLYLETVDGAVPGLKHIVSQQTFDGEGLLRIESFYAMGPDLVSLTALPLATHRDRAIETLNDIARRLQPRQPDVIPVAPGVCIDHAFLPDGPKPLPLPEVNEHIRVGLTLPQFPDTQISIYTAPANTFDPESDSLERQLHRIEHDAVKDGTVGWFLHTTFFRKAHREIGDWKTGFELLTRIPDSEEAKEHFDFRMKFTGVPNDPFKPYADIQMKTGIDKNVVGHAATRMTDDQALHLWDRITSTLRVRPTSPVAEADTTVPVPLGELAATGRVCPRTGWWSCAEEVPVKGGRRQFFYAGDTMPDVVLIGEPSLWKKLRGKQSTYRIDTVWELVALRDASKTGAADASDTRDGPDPAEGSSPAGDDPVGPSTGA